MSTTILQYSNTMVMRFNTKTVYLRKFGDKRMGNAHCVVNVIKYFAQFCLVCCQHFGHFSDHVLYFTSTKAKFQFIYLIGKQTDKKSACN